MHVVFGAVDKVAALLGATEPHKHLKGQSMLVTLGLAKDDTPEGLASAVPHVAVFEVTPSWTPPL